MTTRTENGAAIVPAKHSSALAVPLDIIAKTARVSMGDVVRVLAAVSAIAKHTGADPAELVAWQNIPTGQADAKRAEATDTLFAELAYYQAETEEGRSLSLARRFKRA